MKKKNYCAGGVGIDGLGIEEVPTAGDVVVVVVVVLGVVVVVVVGAVVLGVGVVVEVEGAGV